MRITALVIIATVVAVVVDARENDQSIKRNVTVCVEGGAGFGVKTHAQAIASKMFAGIGVTVVWIGGLRDCPQQGILMSLTDETPAGFIPGALAYARPYGGAHIRVFYDRIVNNRPAVLLPTLLGHVMVHEITHVLQGICEHSRQGVMKASWNQGDFDHMLWRPLPFTEEDIDRIDRGIAARDAKLRSGFVSFAGL